jgi:alpha-mannosidase
MTVQAGINTSVFAVGNAHIDPVWIWDWREGMREVVATFTAAADRLDNTDDLFFTASSAAYYAWVELMDPILFERVKKHVSTGRWCVVGGEWVEPDCNLPSGEAVCRQLLYSQRYFKKTFGIPATVGYNVDSFGHAGSLPQLLKKAGLRGYVMMRPQQHERNIPVSLFNWRGIDGTELPTYRIPIAYTTGQSADHTEAEVVRERATSLLERAGSEKRPLMFFFGVGDHGGGPTRAAIEELRELEATDPGALVFSTPAQYFDVALGVGSMPLETVEGDLHMHAVGCYSVVGWMKAFNTQTERALVEAEQMASLAELATGRTMNVNEELSSAWARVLFNQFHDSLGGTCTAEVHDQLREFYGYALTIADDVATRATQITSTKIDTWVEEAARADRFRSLKPYVEHYPVPVVVFNPLSWDVHVPVLLPHQASAVTDDTDHAVPVQPVPSGEGTRYATRPLAIVTLPARGYRLFWAHDGDPGAAAGPDLDGGPALDGGPGAPQSAPSALAASSTRLSNGLLEVGIDEATGAVTGLIDAAGRRWLQAEGLRPVVLDDPSDTWSHGVIRYEGQEGPCEFVGVNPVENGPVRSTVRLTYRWQNSLIYEDLYLLAGDRALGIRLLIDWHEKHQLLKFVVPVAGAGPQAWVSLPYGAIVRPSDGREEVMHRWVDVEAPNGGLACISDVTYGYDLADGRLRLTILRSPRWADHGAPWPHDRGIESSYTDQGVHRVSLALVPHDGNWAAAGVTRRAEEHCTNFRTVTETWHRGTLGRAYAATVVEPENITLPVLKRAEDGTGWVARIVEVAGQAADARIRIEGLGRGWEGRVGPFEVKTLLFPDAATSETVETDIPELTPTQ